MKSLENAWLVKRINTNILYNIIYTLYTYVKNFTLGTRLGTLVLE